MGDKVLNSSEEELLAQAIALSLASEESPGKSTVSSGAVNGVMASRRPETVGGDNSRVNQATPQSPQGPPMRYGTSQSTDSALADPDDSFLNYQRELSLLSAGSPSDTQRSSPDLGIAAEGDIDPLSGTMGRRRIGDGRASREVSPSSCPEDDQNLHANRTANITLDGHEASGKMKVGEKSEESYRLSFARLSSLHEDASAQVWTPNKDALELIIGMGISENAAKRGLYYTGNENAELAVSWVFENINRPDLHEHFDLPISVPSMGPGAAHFVARDVYLAFDEFAQNRDDAFKMTLVVNSDLKMGIGKIAAQVGHAVLGLYRILENGADLAEWERNGAKKIVLRGKNTVHLMELKRKANLNGLPCLLVQDAGRTQVDPGSLTVLGVFGKCKMVDTVTGDLKLL